MSVLSTPDDLRVEMAQHGERTASLAEWLAVLLGQEAAVARTAGLLHEGARTLPQGATSTQSLNEAAFHAIRLGGSLDVVDAVRLHRERIDGTGPFGLSRRRIPPIAAIVGLAHAFDLVSGGDPERYEATFEFLDGHRWFSAGNLDALRQVLSSQPVLGRRSS